MHSQLSEFHHFAQAAQRAASGSLMSSPSTQTASGASNSGAVTAALAAASAATAGLTADATDLPRWESQLATRDNDIGALLAQANSLLSAMGTLTAQSAADAGAPASGAAG